MVIKISPTKIVGSTIFEAKRQTASAACPSERVTSAYRHATIVINALQPALCFFSASNPLNVLMFVFRDGYKQALSVNQNFKRGKDGIADIERHQRPRGCHHA